MTFFVTSTPVGKGGDLGGLAGADAHCQELAAAVGAGNKIWRAYLSTADTPAGKGINAKDRIGNGPWQNSKGVVVAKDVDDFKNGEITVRFECLSGRIDQGAGILFNLKQNGDYLTVRANCLENNLVLWKFEKGKRSSVEWVRNTPTATRQWHELKVRITGNKVESSLDGKPYLQHTLPEPVSGRIGLWSKADSYMHFDDFAAAASE